MFAKGVMKWPGLIDEEAALMRRAHGLQWAVRSDKRLAQIALSAALKRAVAAARQHKTSAD